MDKTSQILQPLNVKELRSLFSDVMHHDTTNGLLVVIQGETLIEKAGECEVVSPLRRARKPAGLSRVVAVTSDVTKSHRQAMTEHHGHHDPSFVWADIHTSFSYETSLIVIH
jgi:hypothetical protein